MDNPIPELSPDLEWMLESGQASSEMLADALAREYFQPVYRLGLALFNDPKQAEWLAVDSLSAALMQSYSYHGGSVQAWLFRIVLDRYRRNRRKFSHRNEAHNWKPDDGSAAVVPFVENTDERLWGAIRKINRKKHLPFLLTYLYQWPNELVADILEVEPKTIIGQLKLVRHRLIEVLSAPDYPTEGLAYERLDASIHELLERRWPGMSLDADKFQAIMEDVIAGAEQQRSRHLNLASVKEFILVAIVIVLAAGFIYGGNMLFPEPEPTGLTESTAPATRLAEVVPTFIPTFTPQPAATTTPTPLPLPATPQPLTLGSSSNDIHDRLFFGQFYYQKLWLDALLTYYGAEGFADSPQFYRTQIWLDNTLQASLILGGDPGTKAEEIVLNRTGVGYSTEIDGLPPFKLRVIDGSQSSRSVYNARLALYPLSRTDESVTYRVTGREEILGRETLIVDDVNLAGQRIATLWLDSITGLPLRQRYYEPSQDNLLFEVRLLDLAFDPDIPVDLFNPEYPWTGAFAKNATNQPLGPGRIAPNFYVHALAEMKPLPFVLAPADFNPHDSQLYFQFSQMVYANPPQELPLVLYKASVFSESYYLGQLDFENPWTMVCDRSPDGLRLAIANSESPVRSPLRWVDLTDIPETNGKTHFDVVTQFAFAPDNHRLAVFAAHEPYGSIYILDTDNDQITHLIDLPDARSFVWSPDGEYLAMIGRVTQPVAGDEVIVVRTSDGEITYRKSVDYGGGNLGDWPPLEWGVEFPVEMKSLSQCASP